ncbi:putative tRNA-dihydrouridine synthase, aldolase-type TIM barrel [Lupinus albus]|uniref:Putative tRNA-dihydrouridine synthase, aldolase-type TIM barrel n=1 Tax=Lupinus albus TaxID=3870 RepID=A0A6A4R4C8_LUPAL|nr:putative tRNA-dihydrouridine synthase, aldolase-type TIM barrel [Lupinus albus]
MKGMVKFAGYSFPFSFPPITCIITLNTSTFSHRSFCRSMFLSAAYTQKQQSYRKSESGVVAKCYLPPLFSVAPMMDWTDNHYRTLARIISKHAWLYTEMVAAETIVHQKDNLVTLDI